ncbi:MAG: M23 family metallopeptidase [Flavobacteriales bacterium]|nr:M23 family metallopeptidase [Flavobacteriales bacterium]
MKRWLRRGLVLVLLVALAGMLVPTSFTVPVRGADRRSYDQRSYWYHPWGRSVTHKGVDIFARAGTPVVSADHGLVLFAGENGRGGNVVLALGPGWRLHYYAHLREIIAAPGDLLAPGEAVGTVGSTGNAAGKPAHLHYTIGTMLPRPWLARSGPHGWRRMWYLDPTPLLNAACAP